MVDKLAFGEIGQGVDGMAPGLVIENGEPRQPSHSN
jgi:hypothetical protein